METIKELGKNIGAMIMFIVALITVIVVYSFIWLLSNGLYIIATILTVIILLKILGMI